MASLATWAEAGVVIDDSLGEQRHRQLNGPAYDILAEYGERHGQNLFHSFEEFSVAAGEVATFKGPELIRNIVARVTGESASQIDGTVSSEMPEADVYLVNPNGVMFGDGATIDVPRAFAATTADYMRFGDGSEFHASLSADSTLTAAAPTAFGFLGHNTGRLDVSGAELELDARGDGLRLVASDVGIDGARIATNGGDFAAIAVGTEFAGEVGIDGRPAVGAPSVSGELAVRGSEIALGGGDGRGGGAFLRGGEVLVEGSDVHSESVGDGEAVDIELQADRVLTIRDSLLRTRAEGLNTGGDLRLAAPGLSVVGSAVSASTNAAGGSGSIEIEAGQLRIEGTDVSAATAGADGGPAGDVSVIAGDALLTSSVVQSVAIANSARSGDVRVDTASSLLLSGAVIQTEVQSAGDRVGSGDSGALTITAGTFELAGGSKLSAQNFGSGSSGDVDITVTDGPLLLTGESKITARTGTGGSGGNVFIRVPDSHVVIDAGSRISASVVSGSGDGGDVTISARSLVAGPVYPGRVIVVDPSSTTTDVVISARAEDGRGGAIVLDVGGFAASQAQIEVLSATAGRPELAGTISVAAAQVNLAASLQRLSTSLAAENPLARDRCSGAGDDAPSSLTESTDWEAGCEPHDD